MSDATSSARVQALAAATRPFMRFFTESAYARKAGTPGVSDFAVGNPHEMALPGLVAGLQRWAVPQDERWYAYKLSEPESREVVAASLRHAFRAGGHRDDQRRLRRPRDRPEGRDRPG